LNSQKYKIQALIAEIDEVLSKPAPRLPWTGSLDTVHQRQLLERVRAYLVSSDSKVAARKAPPSPNVRPAPVPVPKVPPRAEGPSVTEQIMLAVTGEISNLRSGLTGPLQEDIEALRQEQQALIQEIKQLEAKRQQQQSLAQQQANQQQIISEFLQVLTGRLEETLDRDLSQIFSSLENQLLPSSTAQSQQSALNPQTSSEHPLLTPAQRLEQMQRFQASADSLLMRLDSTMGIVFEALEANLQSYQASLGQGLENMYGLSQQSEAMFAAFVNHLAAQLRREGSSYVQQPIALANLETASPTAADRSDATSALSNTAIEPSADADSEERSGELLEQDRLPYAGTEISPQFGQLRRDRDRLEAPISLPDLEDNLSDFTPERHRPVTLFPGADSEDILAENGENVEDLYASLFAGEAVAELELELEDFTIENSEVAAEIEPAQSQTADSETAEPLNTAEDLFVNLLDEGESLEDFLESEDSEFVIGNSVDALTLDTEDLFEPQVRTVPEVSEPSALSSIAPTLPSVSEPPASTAEPQIDFDDRENLETAQNRGDRFDTAAVPPPPAEISPNQPSGRRVPSARDVQTGEFGTSSQGLDDVYIQASPDEDLLPVEALEDDLDRALKLDVNTMELLEADLYNLEGLDNTAQRRSNSSAVNSLDLLASSPEDDADNPFAEAAEEELGSLEDLFSDALELSSEDELFVLEDELEEDLFAGEDESNLTLDEILASLKETDQEEAQILETEELPSNPPESKKKT
jgi:hypothetical protein